MRWTRDRRGRTPTAQPGATLARDPSSAATEAALSQRITGSGSGPYSGTPFSPRTDVAGTTAAGTPNEASRHDHGIIDRSRHVSSVGRR